MISYSTRDKQSRISRGARDAIRILSADKDDYKRSVDDEEVNTNLKPGRRGGVAYAFIDSANLLYGGTSSLGWKVDYRKLARYLKERYGSAKIFYFAGIEIYDYPYSLVSGKQINLDKLLKFLQEEFNRKKQDLTDEVVAMEKNIQKVKLFQQLQRWGYTLRLKPIKTYEHGEGEVSTIKANCDVDLTFEIMKNFNKFSRLVLLSGDGDFTVVLKHVLVNKKKIAVISRNERTAKEIRQLAGNNFKNFNELQYILRRSR